MTSLVSVIMPAYNAEAYITQAIESILAQTYHQWELVVINDGSTDNTQNIVSSFTDHRIRSINQENHGLGEARNTGICAAKGEFIALLDADDTWKPSYIDKMTALLNSHPSAAAVYSGFQYINSLGNLIGKPNLKIVAPDVFHNTLIFEGNWLVPSAVVFRKQLVEEVGLFDGSLLGVEDADFWIRLSAQHMFVGLPAALVNYRIHNENMSKDPGHMMTGGRRLAEKRHGPPSGDVSLWPETKRRAYTLLYRYGVGAYLSAGDVSQSVDYFLRVLEIAPDKVLDMAFWRMIVRAHLSVEYRNDPTAPPIWDLAQRDIENLLYEIEHRCTQQKIQRSKMRGSALLALADEAAHASEPNRSVGGLMNIALRYPHMLLTRRYYGTLIRSFFPCRR